MGRTRNWRRSMMRLIAIVGLIACAPEKRAEDTASPACGEGALHSEPGICAIVASEDDPANALWFGCGDLVVETISPPVRTGFGDWEETIAVEEIAIRDGGALVFEHLGCLTLLLCQEGSQTDFCFVTTY